MTETLIPIYHKNEAEFKLFDWFFFSNTQSIVISIPLQPLLPYGTNTCSYITSIPFRPVSFRVVLKVPLGQQAAYITLPKCT